MRATLGGSLGATDETARGARETVGLDQKATDATWEPRWNLNFGLAHHLGVEGNLCPRSGLWAFPSGHGAGNLQGC